MSNITVSIPPQFEQPLNELVNLSQASSREVWLANVVRNLVLDYQMRKEFSAQQQMRFQQLSAYWPNP